MSRVTIIGGGWAGLATAVYLSHKNIPVELYERSKQIGGRSRCIPFGNHRVDYGQHILFGSYKYTRSLLKMIDIDEKNFFSRKTFRIANRNLKYNSLIKFFPWFSPLNLLGILSARGVFLKDKISALNLLSKIAVNKLHLTKDISVLEFLKRQKQSDSMIHEFWNPLCGLSLNCQTSMASAQVFINFIRQTLLGKSLNSAYYLPTETLSETFSQKAIDFIEKKGSKVTFGKEIDTISISDGVISLKSQRDSLSTDYLVIATPAKNCHALISGIVELSDLYNNLGNFTTQSLRTVYLQYPEKPDLEFPITCLSGKQQFWIYDRGIANQEGILAVKVIDDPNNPVPANEIVNTVSTEISKHYPHWSKPVASILIEDSSGILCEPDISKLRPGCRTSIKNIFLAGDYINSSLPANLETTVMSGMLSAQKIINAIEG